MTQTEPLTSHQRAHARRMGVDIARAATWNGCQINAHQTFTDIEETITSSTMRDAYVPIAVVHAREWWSDNGFRMSADG